MRKLALIMMVKNEEKYAIRSIKSVSDIIDTIVIYDTGSTDNTVSEITQWCANNKKTLHLKEGEFVDFSVSRNVLLAHAHETAKEPFLLALDANDELQGDVQKIPELLVEGKVDGALLKQMWRFGKASTTVYKNIRIMANNGEWKYKGAVHEYADFPGSRTIDVPDFVWIFQDREDDGGKSQHRIKMDYQMLSDSVKRNPDNPRDTFYLARTCVAVGKRDEANVHFLKRLTQGDFIEELFWCHMGLAENYLVAGYIHMAIESYMKALEVRQRAEPLNALCCIFLDKKLFFSAFGVAKLACELPFPSSDILFIDKNQYDYKRWHLLGISAFYCGMFEIGELACRQAITASDLDIDKNNLKFYLDRKETAQAQRN